MLVLHKAKKDLKPQGVPTVRAGTAPPQKLQVFANAIKDIPGMDKAILQGTPPMGLAQNIDVFSFQPTGTEYQQVSAHIGNEEFIPFYGMRLVAGRNMMHSDSLQELGVNGTTARLSRWK